MLEWAAGNLNRDNSHYLKIGTQGVPAGGLKFAVHSKSSFGICYVVSKVVKNEQKTMWEETIL